MRRFQPTASLPSRAVRAVALLVSALVVLLALTSASPELHAWLHQDSPDPVEHTCSQHPRPANDDTDHGCAVALYAQGVVHHAAALLTQPCEEVLRAIDYRAFERLALAHPRYLHLPPQAPPAA